MKSYESKQSLKLWFDMSCVPFPTAGSLADAYSSGHMLNINESHTKSCYDIWYR